MDKSYRTLGETKVDWTGPAPPRVPGVPDEDRLHLMSGLIDADKLLQ